MNILKMIISGPSAPFAGEMQGALLRMEEALSRIARGGGALRGSLERVVASGGTRLRPLLSWICWHFAGGGTEIVPLMVMIELTHTASLIHGELVNGVTEHRGVKTISATDGGLAALRSGDYLLSRAMELQKFYRGSGVIAALSEVAQEMSRAGMEHRAGLYRTQGVSIEDYFLRIRRKTSLFLAECCRGGAALAGAGEAEKDALWRYGMHLGLALQLRNDLLDFDSALGKPPLRNLRNGVVSLPVLLALESGSAGLAALVERRNKTPEELNAARAAVERSGALHRTEKLLLRTCGAATAALSPLSQCAEIETLTALANAAAR